MYKIKKSKKNEDIWYGYIDNFTDDVINCILRKDYNLDKELNFGRGLLSKEQNKLICLGLLIKYDIKNHKILLASIDKNLIQNWI